MATSTKRSLSPLALILILSGAFFLIFLMISGIVFMYKTPGTGTAHSSAPLFGSGSVAVIELNGVIMESKKILTKLERFEEDDDIKAVVLRLNSPGGAVAPSQEIYEAVRKYKKPLVVSMGSIAASGAFYIACGAKKVFANAGTITGSIGVIMEFANLEKLYDWAKIKRYAIKTGKFKDTGAEYREMTAEDRALLQGMVDDVLSQFKQAVSTGRKMTMAQVTSIADGRVLSGSQAKAAKLVDELGTLQDAIDEAAKEAKIKGKPSVVYPEKPRRKLLEYLLDSSDKGDDSESSITHAVSGNALERVIRGFLSSSDTRLVTGLEPGIYWLWKGAE